MAKKKDRKTFFTQSKTKATKFGQKGWTIWAGSFYCEIDKEIKMGWYCTPPEERGS